MEQAMQAEREVVRFLSAYQAIWHAHFPSLFRRAQWHIVTHLCTTGREGAAVGEPALALSRERISGQTVVQGLSVGPDSSPNRRRGVACLARLGRPGF